MKQTTHQSCGYVQEWEPDFVFDGETLDKLKTTMNLTDEQHDALVRAAAGEDVQL